MICSDYKGTICPESSNPFYIVTHYINWGNYFLDTWYHMSKFAYNIKAKNTEKYTPFCSCIQSNFFFSAEWCNAISIQETEIEPVYAAYIIPGSRQLEKIYKAIHTQYSLSFTPGKPQKRIFF